jgi:dTDP-glucose 4,6-dehydratase
MLPSDAGRASSLKTLLITGGCGFIGSNLIRFILALRPECRVINLDARTCAGNPKNLFETDQFQKDLKQIARSGVRKLVSKLYEYVYPQIRSNPATGANIKR